MADGIVQDMEIEKLKEIYFERLLEQLKTNERHQEDQDSLLLEMFLAYIHSKQISFKEFIRIIIDVVGFEVDQLSIFFINDAFDIGFEAFVIGSDCDF